MALRRHPAHTFVVNKFLQEGNPGNNLHPLQTLQPRNVSHFCKEVRDELKNYFMIPDCEVEWQYRYIEAPISIDRLEHLGTQRHQTTNPTCRKLARTCPRASEGSSSRDTRFKVSGVAQFQGSRRDTALTSVFTQTLGV
ncbi:hypothetical protein PR048_020390 [Dryococelus australis]|uniref:Uncharacterized protein n=1 Tax=Dryococelus australis TaxID=614101 RepID=A0ABQ9H667_9NEOP|nr:hypothetical protein PR048_020390 [Dryococelus australis]